MTAFERLHPALQHHIVNSLGWRSLRPVQEMSIEAALEGDNLIVLAPTAGGKTEAAFFPLISETLAHDWPALSVLYVSPIRALLNNQEPRLQHYYGLVGRRAEVWHGDVTPTRKNHIIAEPPDCLLTTPESLEAILVSSRLPHAQFFQNLQAIVVDEVHAFAGDDRGWHLLAVLERLQKLAGRDLQRIGLSATVGNPSDLSTWLATGSKRAGRVIRPPGSDTQEPHVELDYVAKLENTATVIAALHKGEKRLVFVDSRARVEKLAAELRSRDVTTYVSHSSLGLDERRQAERAFAQGSDCVIVATSALELGIDVGDLDRVIQIDAPTTVSSFLQRMGRTGRRAGAKRNCLFLATSPDALLQSAGLLELWRSGFVEPVTPTPAPLHIVAQQLMALALQEKGLARSDWPAWLSAFPSMAKIDAASIEGLIAWMLSSDLFWEDAGLLWFGREGQATYGKKNFLELVSVFTSPPLFVVRHGRKELGQVHESTFLAKEKSGPSILLLGGRSWKVTQLDWNRRLAWVEATEEQGRTRWLGEGQHLSYALCQQIRRVLANPGSSSFWTQRAVSHLDEERGNYEWLSPEDVTVLRRDPTGELAWWTFAGGRANAALAYTLEKMTGAKAVGNNFRVCLFADLTPQAAEDTLKQLAETPLDQIRPEVDERALQKLKFSDCLPPKEAAATLVARLEDRDALEKTLTKKRVHLGG